MAKKKPATKLKPSTVQTEEEALEAAREWWNKNWLSIIGGVGLGLAGIAGWYFWQNYHHDYFETASSIYFDFVKDEQKIEHDDSILDRIDLYRDTPYPVFTRLERARAYIENGELDKAAADVVEAYELTEQESLKGVIKSRHVRILLAQGKYQEALDAVSDYIYSSSEQNTFEMLRGDALLGLGQKDAALEAYRKAAQASAQPSPYLRLKLESLGG